MPCNNYSRLSLTCIITLQRLGLTSIYLHKLWVLETSPSYELDMLGFRPKQNGHHLQTNFPIPFSWVKTVTFDSYFNGFCSLESCNQWWFLHRRIYQSPLAYSVWKIQHQSPPQFHNCWCPGFWYRLIFRKDATGLWVTNSFLSSSRVEFNRATTNPVIAPLVWNCSQINLASNGSKYQISFHR